jgi:hypothetical protein
MYDEGTTPQDPATTSHAHAFASETRR